MTAYDKAQKFITDLQFNNLMQKYVWKIRKNLNQNLADRIVPELFVLQSADESEKPELLSIKLNPGRFNSDLGLQIRKAGQLVCKERFAPVAIFLIMEAWTKQFDTNQPTIKQDKPVEQYADKKEIMMVAGMTIDARVNLATMDIQRIKDNKIWLRNPTFELYDNSQKIEVYTNLLIQFHLGYLEQFDLSYIPKNYRFNTRNIITRVKSIFKN